MELLALRTWTKRLAYAAAGTMLFAGLGWCVERGWQALRSHGIDVSQLPRSVVHREDMHVTLRAGGRVESAQQTLIECELELLQFSSEGRTFSAGGNSTILSIIPEGSQVKKDEVLCRLDSSDYEELVRQQQIKVDQTKADFSKANLDVRAAEMALREYREGTLAQLNSEYRGQLVLAETDQKRELDRLAWVKRMVHGGYLSEGQLIAQQASVLRAQINLTRVKGEAWNLRQFGGPIHVRRLEVALEQARAIEEYQKLRLNRSESLLRRFKKQVGLCTVRAPHDGFVIYANEPDGDPRVELGARVRQKMDLFYLPDLAHMLVKTLLHETVVDRVRNGMPARVRVEAMPRIPIEGHVVAVSALPTMQNARSGTDVRQYMGLIQLHSSPRGLRPGMTAEVEILTAQRPNALVIPPGALTVEAGRDYCYVASSEGVERRLVTVGQGTRTMLEVTDGLDEGEQVILDPTHVDLGSSLLVDSLFLGDELSTRTSSLGGSTH